MSVSNKVRFEQLLKTLKAQKINFTVNFYESYYTTKETVIRRRKDLCSYLFDGYSGNRFDAGNLRYTDRFWIMENYGLSAMQTFEEETIVETKNIVLNNILVVEFENSVYTIEKNWIDEPAEIGSLIEVKIHPKATDIFTLPYLHEFGIWENFNNQLCLYTWYNCSKTGLQFIPKEKTKLFLDTYSFELMYYSAKHNINVIQKPENNGLTKRIEFLTSVQTSGNCYYIDSATIKSILGFKDSFLIDIKNNVLTVFNKEKNELFKTEINCNESLQFCPKLFSIIISRLKLKTFSFFYDKIKKVMFTNTFYLACMQKLD